MSRSPKQYTRDEKYCEVCGIFIPRNRKLSAKQWTKKKFCSFKCGGKALSKRMGSYSFRRGKKFAIPRQCSACSEVSESVWFYKKWNRALCRKHYKQMYDHGRILWDERVKITPLTRRIRHCDKSVEWRKAVYERDNYTCQLCGTRGAYLEADHYPITFAEIFHSNNIKNLKEALACEKFWDISNGRTLCKDCHRGKKSIHFDIINKG